MFTSRVDWNFSCKITINFPIVHSKTWTIWWKYYHVKGLKIGLIFILWALFLFFLKENLIAVNGGKTALLKWSLSSFFQLYLFDYCTLYLRKHAVCK